jgi:hypothetical protein
MLDSKPSTVLPGLQELARRSRGGRELGGRLVEEVEEKAHRVAERSASRAVRGRSAMVMTRERGRWVVAVDL